MPDRAYNVLILCTGNSARSILGEVILNREGQGRINAYSAGSQPKGEINPLALDLLRRLGYPTERLRSKTWDEFARPDAPQMDFVITVCDNAAGEACPIWPGKPVTAHWGIPDPAAVEGSEAEKRAAFEETYRRLSERARAFLSLPIETLDERTLRAKLKEIGEMEGVTLRPNVA